MLYAFLNLKDFTRLRKGLNFQSDLGAYYRSKSTFNASPLGPYYLQRAIIDKVTILILRTNIA